MMAVNKSSGGTCAYLWIIPIALLDNLTFTYLFIHSSFKLSDSHLGHTGRRRNVYGDSKYAFALTDVPFTEVHLPTIFVRFSLAESLHFTSRNHIPQLIFSQLLTISAISDQLRVFKVKTRDFDQQTSWNLWNRKKFRHTAKLPICYYEYVIWCVVQLIIILEP